MKRRRRAVTGLLPDPITSDWMVRTSRFGCPIPAKLAAVTDRRYRRLQPRVRAYLPQRNATRQSRNQRIQPRISRISRIRNGFGRDDPYACHPCHPWSNPHETKRS